VPGVKEMCSGGEKFKTWNMCYWDCRDKHSLLQAGEWNSVLPV